MSEDKANQGKWHVAPGEVTTAPGLLLGLSFSTDFLSHLMFIVGRYCTEKRLCVQAASFPPASHPDFAM